MRALIKALARLPVAVAKGTAKAPVAIARASKGTAAKKSKRQLARANAAVTETKAAFQKALKSRNVRETIKTGKAHDFAVAMQKSAQKRHGMDLIKHRSARGAIGASGVAAAATVDEIRNPVADKIRAQESKRRHLMNYVELLNARAARRKMEEARLQAHQGRDHAAAARKAAETKRRQNGSAH